MDTTMDTTSSATTATTEATTEATSSATTEATTATAEESAQVRAKRERAEQLTAQARDAFATQQRLLSEQHTVDEGLATRRAAQEQAHSQAQQAAAAALRIGTATAQRSERSADTTALRIARELERANASAASLASEVAAATAAFRTAQQAVVEADYEYQMAAICERQRQRLAREQALRAELATLVREGRADGRVAVRMYTARETQRGVSYPITERGARNRVSDALYMPAEELARNARTNGAILASAFAEEGVFVVYAADLSRADADEDDGRARASVCGGDLAEFLVR